MMRLPIALVLALHISDVQIQAQAPSGTNCICTPFYKCYDSETNSNLDGLVNDRVNIIDNRPVLTVRQENDPRACQDMLDVCCHNLVPSSQTPSSQRQPISSTQIPRQGGVPLPIEVGIRQPIESYDECGVRNINGVGFSIEGFTEGQAQYGEFPWMVALLTSNTGLSADLGAKNLYVGGGSLIDPLVVLTTGHKPFDLEANKALSVRVGEWNFREVSEPTQHQDIPVKEIIYHPGFNRDLRIFNYALLILERPAILGETVRTICLPSDPTQRFDGQQCIISGWGKDVFGDKGYYQRIMKSVTVNMVGHSQCQSALQTTRLGSRFILHSSFVCAGDQGQDSCTGDGGSPLVCPDPMSPGQYVQVGASAWGIGCGQPGIPGVYAAMAPVVDWIQETLDKSFDITEELVDDRIVIVGATKLRRRCPECQRYSPKTKICHRRLRCRRA